MCVDFSQLITSRYRANSVGATPVGASPLGKPRFVGAKPLPSLIHLVGVFLRDEKINRTRWRKFVIDAHLLPCVRFFAAITSVGQHRWAANPYEKLNHAAFGYSLHCTILLLAARSSQLRSSQLAAQILYTR